MHHYRNYLEYLKTVHYWAHGFHCNLFKGGPPYDPFVVASSLGVQITFDDLNGVDGYVEIKGDGYHVLLSSRASETRRRWTLAHEIGHVLLMNVAKKDGFHDSYLIRYRNNGLPRHDTQDKNEERLCNAFAQEFLLPTESVKDRITAKDPTPDQFLEIATKFKVSLQAVAFKVTGLLKRNRIRCSLWCLKTPWPMAAWWAGKGVLAKSDVTILEELARLCISEQRELTEIWGRQGRRHFDLRVRMAPANGRGYAIAVLSPFQSSRENFTKGSFRTIVDFKYPKQLDLFKQDCGGHAVPPFVKPSGKQRKTQFDSSKP